MCYSGWYLELFVAYESDSTETNFSGPIFFPQKRIIHLHIARTCVVLDETLDYLSPQTAEEIYCR